MVKGTRSPGLAAALRAAVGEESAATDAARSASGRSRRAGRRQGRDALMSEVSPMQALALWKLALSPSEQEPEVVIVEMVTKRGLDDLVAAHLVARESYALSLTEDGWAWVGQHFRHPIGASKKAGEVLQALLGKLGAYLEANDLALYHFLRAKRSGELTGAAPPPENLASATLEDRIRAAYLRASGNRWNEYVRLVRLRAELPGEAASDVDAALVEMQRKGGTVLFQGDNPQDLGPEDDAAALYVSGARRDDVCMWPESADVEPATIEERIRAAYLRATGGTYNEQIKMAHLRAELLGEDRDAVDRALLGMQQRDEVVLYPINNPRELRPVDDAAALRVAGTRRDLVLFERARAEPGVPSRKTAASTLEERIRAAYLLATGDKHNEYVKLARLRAALPGEAARDVDAALIEMRRKGSAVLYPIDDPQRFGPEDARAALYDAGERRDLVAIRPAPVAPPTLEERIRAAYLRATGNRYNEQIKIARLRAELPGEDRTAVDDALLRLQQRGEVILYHIDDPQRLRPEDNAAALRVAGYQRDLVALLRGA
jgi:hypothetical protein